ncbi:MAG: homocysteine S-methyltransferase family protein [Treponema sp.]|jgi:5-methyltetrahydrofolate--homocysteine methyltransferase|nr:homocysteine S-methyltransferase family protein [Treponema sp.]
MTIREQLKDIASQRILVLDGAMGSMLQRHTLTEAEFRGKRFAAHPGTLLGCNDVLCLSKPSLVSDIHEAYLKAGADIIETCSFNATAVSLAGFGIADCAYDISFAAASLARKVADAWSMPEKPRFVAGSMGPTAKCAGIPSDFANPAQRAVSWDELSAAYYDNARGLLDGGADLLLVETVIDSINAKAALYAIGCLRNERRSDIPVIVSASVAHGGRILSGQTLSAFYVAMSHADPIAIGMNCSFGATTMLPYLRQLATVPCMIIAYPNAGMPNQAGDYDETPAIMAQAEAGFMNEGLVNIVGGCCGSTPEHIAAIAEKVLHYRPRALPKPSPVLPLSGLEPGTLPEHVVYDDRVETLVAAGDYDEAVELLRSAAEAGASYIALRLDDDLHDAPRAMQTLVNLALSYPDIARLPFVIGGSRWPVVEAALKCLPGRGLVDASHLADADKALIQRYGEAYLTNL